MIYVPDYLWSKAIDSLRCHRKATERVLYLDGFRSNDYGVTTTITVPNAALRRGSFRVTSEAMSIAGEHLHELQMRRLAQLHTHGDHNVDHSETDDTLAYSQREGALSIVVPNYARKRLRLIDCGVHIRRANGWERVAEQEIALYLRVLPAFLDFSR